MEKVRPPRQVSTQQRTARQTPLGDRERAALLRLSPSHPVFTVVCGPTRFTRRPTKKPVVDSIVACTRHGVRYMIHESEATADLVTQLFLSQLCARPLAAG